MENNTVYNCECGKCFTSRLGLYGHYANCETHNKIKHDKIKIKKESRRLQNGMFKCENPKCNKEHDGSYGSGRFCSDKCRKTFIGIKGYRTKVENGTYRCNFNINKENNNRSPYGTWKCILCNLIFNTRQELYAHNHEKHKYDKSHAWNYGLTKDTDLRILKSCKKVSESLKNGYKSGKRKTPKWTDEMKKKQSQNAKRRGLGGYHRHGGKGIRGWYKGYWCDSSWELAYVIYNIEHNIQFIRNKEGFEYEFNNVIRKYYPDFILSDGSYVEIKGWYDKKTIVKISSFINRGYKLTVLDKISIKPYLEYVISKYGKDFTRLYESRK